MTAWGTIWKEPVMSNCYVDIESYLISNAVNAKPQEPELIFECDECKVGHDPCTTSFAKLCETAKELGWIIRFYDSGYATWCNQCEGMIK